MNAAQAYAAAVDALQAARRARQDALRHCENYEAGEDADASGYPGSPGYAACFWDGERARADWCEACAARTDLGDWKALKREKARAQAEVLRAGRAGSEVDAVTRTSVALVKARDEVRRLTKERAAFLCEREGVDDPEGEERRVIDPCWRATYEKPDPDCGGGGWSLAVEPEDWCPSCQQRQVVFLQLRAARRRVVALTSGHLNATRAHMRRTGELPPTPPKPARPKVEAPKPLMLLQPLPPEDADDVPF